MINYRKFDDTLLVSVCERFLRGDTTLEIANWLNDEHDIPATRENIYPLLREARRRGYFFILPPPEGYLQQRICDSFRLDQERVHVLRVRGDAARDYVADAAAQEIVQLVHELKKRKKERVRIGLGGGGTVLRVARALGSRLRLEGSLPKLGLHALTSGFDVHNPWTAPVSFFGHFDRAAPDIEYVGLSAPAVVEAEEYDHVKELPEVNKSFSMAKKIDIVITSLASSSDKHGELNRFMNLSVDKTMRVRALKKSGWVGDVSYRPYSRKGPIVTTAGIRAVSLFEVDDLVKLAKKPNKHVVLVAAPCGGCNETKGEALLPLLERKNLRLWTHLFMDLTTAQSLLPKEA
jgi:DNA-binding transcriptional regulator LsrR (DeoR family)